MAKLLPFDPCPTAGGGVHSWIMRAAWACRFKMDNCTAAEAEGLILDAMTRNPNPKNEVSDAVNKVFNATLEPRAQGFTPRFSSPKKWPEPNAEQIEAVAAAGLSVADLWEASPIRFDDDEPHAAEILERLFPGDPWLCAGSKYQFFTQRLSLFKGAAYAFEQIIPSPMLSKYGKTKDGKLSQRTLDATGPRRFLVVEGDKINGINIPKDTQAAVLLHLGERAPLSLVVDSGGKSLHGWFFVAGKTDDQLAPFFRRACTLGADKMLWGRAQFARMPDGTRDTGKRQHILFFNPETITR
jgi:hypothetical protein